MVHEAAKAGFGKEANVYASARPTYHPKLIDRFAQHYADGLTVEVGAGTGIFTSQLIDSGINPVAIEPVASMRQVNSSSNEHVRLIAATAEATGLASGSAGTVVAAQAFHWFDYPNALDETARILVPKGFFVCAWNTRDDSVDWVHRYDEVIDRYAGDTPRHKDMNWYEALEEDHRFELVDDWKVDNPATVTPDYVVDRALSISFIASLEKSQQDGVLAEVRQIVGPLGDTVEFPYRSELQAWQVAASGLDSPQG